MADRKLLNNIAAKLSRGQPLTPGEKKAHARWERDTEAKWRARIYRDVPIVDAAKLFGVNKAKLLKFAEESGLPIGEVTDLAKLFPALLAMRERLKPETEDSYTTDEGLICTTYESAARALKSRIGIGCAKSVQNWIAQGMPGTPGQGVSRVGRFPIDEMEAWAKANLTLTAKQLDEAAAERRRRKEEAEILRIEARNAREAKKDAILDGTLLPRDTYTAFAIEIVGTLTQVLMRLPKELLRGGFVAHDKKDSYEADAEKRIRFALSEAKKQLERGPDQNS